MLFAHASASPMSQPPTSGSTTPLLEKHRIVGSLRERTIYVPVPSPQSDVDDSVKILSATVAEHVETFLSVHESYIEAEIAEIEELAQKKVEELEELSRGIAKLRKMLSNRKKKGRVQMQHSIW